MARRNHSAGGFTLIELLVAIGILAMVAVLGWRGLDSIMRSREVLTGQAHQGQAVIFRRQVQAAIQQGIALAASEQEPQQLQVVTYRLRGGVLTRRESNGTRDLAVLDTLWQAARDDTDTSNADVALMHGVDSMVMRGQKRQNSPNPEWITMLAGTKTDDFVGLEVTLQMPGQDAGLSKVFLLGPG